jgi:hypothetical protein
MSKFKTEKQLQQYSKKLAIAHGCDWYKMECVGQTGFPDVMVTFQGWIIFIELKSPSKKGVLSARQIHMLARLTNQGIETYVIDNQRHLDLIISGLIKRQPRPLPDPSI